MKPPGKRLLFRMCVFLLLGAIVNVAVAWGCALRVDSLKTAARQTVITETGAMASTLVSEIDWTEEAYALDEWLEDHRRSKHELETHRNAVGAGLEADEYDAGIAYFPNSSPFRMNIASRLTAGWPLLSLTGGEWVVYEWSEAVGAERYVRTERLAALSPQIGGFTNILPLEPTWPGFAINTIFYAAVLWMVFAFPFVERRRRRIKRGLCPACAYPVGTSPVCTECGTPLTTA